MEKIKNFFLKNTSEKQTAVKNTVWLIVGEIIGRLFKLAIVLFATRRLGVDGWGVFSYGLAFISAFFLLADLGVNTFLTREMSKDSEEKKRYVSSSTIIKVFLVLFFFIVTLIFAPHLGKIQLGLDMVIILAILFLSDSIREFALAINRAEQKMEREAFSKILMNSIITFLGIILILEHAAPLSLAIAYMIGSITASVYIFWSIKDVFRNFQWNVSKKDIRIIYDFSWPIIVISLFSFVFSIDTIMLGQFRSATEVGLYAAAQRLVQFTAVIPAFIAMAIFPILSKHEGDETRLAGIFEKVMLVTFAIGIPIAIGGFLLGTPLMMLIFGPAYLSGGITLSILMLSLLAAFPNTILTNAIFSKNLQRIFIMATSLGVAINIALNFLLIPIYGTLGAAISITITQLLIMAINWRKFKKFLSFSVVPKLGRIVIAGIVMALAILIMQTIGLNIIILIGVAAITYFCTLLVLKEASIGEVFSLVKNR